MAPKQSDKLPAPSSSDEEEDTTSEAGEEEEEDETSDEEEEQSQIPMTQKISQIKKPEVSPPIATVIESSESEGSESETDSDSAPVVKPLATKPMVDDAKKQQSVAKPSASGAKSKAKRPVESNSKPDQKDSKRAKKESGNGRAKNDSEDGKKILFQRIWSVEDEIALLKGMIEFKSETGTDPAADVSAFYGFVKNSLHMDFGIVKLRDKMARLKKKFKNHVKRGTHVFGKEHDQEAYNLSKKIWLDDGEIVKAESSAQSNGKSKKNQHAATPVKATAEASTKSNKEVQWQIKKHDVHVPLDKKIGVGSIEEQVLLGMDLIPSEKKAALEKRWKKLRIAEMELFLQRNELVAEQAKLMLDFYKSGKN